MFRFFSNDESCSLKWQFCKQFCPERSGVLCRCLCSVFHTDQDDPSSSDDEGMPYTRPAKFKAAHSFKGPFDFDQIKVVQDLSGEHMVRPRCSLLLRASAELARRPS